MELVPSSNVYPSGAAFDASSEPKLPPAPLRFSMISGWPIVWLMWLEIRRAVISVCPPGAKGTISLTARAGYLSCAIAAVVRLSIAARPVRANRVNCCMDRFLFFL